MGGHLNSKHVQVIDSRNAGRVRHRTPDEVGDPTSFHCGETARLVRGDVTSRAWPHAQPSTPPMSGGWVRRHYDLLPSDTSFLISSRRGRTLKSGKSARRRAQASRLSPLRPLSRVLCPHLSSRVVYQSPASWTSDYRSNASVVADACSSSKGSI